jgi:uncharacterized protein YecT (DUF1311 family)
MEMKVVLLAVICFVGVGVPAAAARPLSPEYSGCLDKASGVTPAMIDCIVSETSRQDIQLNENYRALGAKISQKRKRALIEAQRAWIKFRDANCDFYDDPDGGTGARLSAAECVLNATVDRANELKLLIPE